MYIIQDQCRYCKKQCSRESAKGSKMPKLYTPDMPGMEKVVCEYCLDKILDKLKIQYKKWALSEE